VTAQREPPTQTGVRADDRHRGAGARGRTDRPRGTEQGRPAGIQEALKLVGALLTFGLIAAVAVVVLSAITWSVGSHSSNPAVAGRARPA
jgi:hypothetical protein